MGVVEAENDVFGGINFVEDFNHEIFELALVFGGGNEAGSIKGINLTIFEAGGDFGIGVH